MSDQITADKTDAQTTDALGFDPQEVLAKYKHERDKRVRSDGSYQYAMPTGDLARFADADPHADPDFQRDAVTEAVDVVIIGGGFSGMLAAARLHEAGIKDVRIIERAADFGGTWYWNRYPGVQCDIESYCYLPLLEEMGYMPKEKYSFGDEIFAHSRRIGDWFDLYPSTLFQTTVTRAEWQDDKSRWAVTTDRGDAITAQYIVMAIGSLNVPKLPGIPGINDYKGHSFHSSRWDYDYTGGNSKGGLDKLKGKRIAVIGTGATGIQLIPHVAKTAEHLYVFQRTPSSVGERGNTPTDEAWYKAQGTGWQKNRRQNFDRVVRGQPYDVDLVQDGWTEIGRQINTKKVEGETPEQLAERMQLADLEKMHELRQRVDDTVQDKAAADALKAWYNRTCKRPTFNDEFLPAFNQPNVDLIDVSDAQGVERITEKGVVANGKEYEVDCIIYASGFQIAGSVSRRLVFDVIGKDGTDLKDHWDTGFKTLHGLTTSQFPNWFHMGVSQTPLAPNFTALFDEQAEHLAYIVKSVKERGGQRFETTEQAEQEWIHICKSTSYKGAGFYEACTPGYYNNEGEAGPSRWDDTYSPGPDAFRKVLSDWRDDGKLDGLAVS